MNDRHDIWDPRVRHAFRTPKLPPWIPQQISPPRPFSDAAISGPVLLAPVSSQVPARRQSDPTAFRSPSRITTGTGPTRTLLVPALSGPAPLAPASWHAPARRQSDPMVPRVTVPDHASCQPNPAPFLSLRYPVRAVSFRSQRRSRFDDNRPPRPLGSLSRIGRRLSPSRTLFGPP
jgi:hypothetical protein